ncbi:GAF sensor-containing diguanylate cyclase [Candidatus Magnetobacterium bavaricum]|uniref:diguanylate cyclase n=1 Tax=Candidatus Magnetobacterium bavaricum TaxID=29290 RepID=A0A0F3GX09_9BACT|nr:GAF sensor-containing diguanylate cyclase [Candidatus Magnetobacterium bavaricum]
MYQLKKKMLVAIVNLLLLCSLIAVVSVLTLLPKALLKNTEQMTHALSDTMLMTLKHLMMTHEPDAMQSIFDTLSRDEDTISAAFIVNDKGRIVYSTDRTKVGITLDHFKEDSCIICHKSKDSPPSQKTQIVKNARGEKVSRNVSIILNDPTCHGCHAKETTINGKLIIDRPLKHTESIIRRVEVIVFALGLACLVIVIVALTRVVNKYIFEILKQNHEITLLYSLMERLSKTIDVEELKVIAIDIIRETLKADMVIIALPKQNRQYRAYTKDLGKDRLVRVNLHQNEQLAGLINEWYDGTLSEFRMSRDKKEVYMNIYKTVAEGGEKDKIFALFVCQKFVGSFDAGMQGIVAAISKHVEIAFENAWLYNLAITDELSGLYTQRHFRHIIEREFDKLSLYNDGITLLMIDIDNFKKVNDAYGHVVGDMVIEGVASCIRSAIRDNDMPFRYGGEEFAIVLPATDIESGYIIAERIREEVEDAVFEDGTVSIKISISVGVANCPKDADNVRGLIVKADNAMYEAKRSGKNIVVKAASEATNNAN